MQRLTALTIILISGHQTAITPSRFLIIWESAARAEILQLSQIKQPNFFCYQQLTAENGLKR
jgi:hypothetical protein